MLLVTDPRDVDVLAEAIAGSAAVGFDCEFLSQDRLVPQLCLLQLAFERDGVQHIAVVDCLALDVASLVSALVRHPLPIAHAPRQDLQLLATRFGADIPQIFDLQTAAAFIGLGDQVGYGKLVAALLGVDLSKDLQWTDWARRPLSDAHLAYAAADVFHLLPLYRALVTRLGPRRTWVQLESRRLADLAREAAELCEQDAWESVAGSGGLPAHASAVVVALAGWRLRTARELDRPLGHVLSDKELIDLARRPPRDRDALRRRAKASALHERADEVMIVLAAVESRDAPPRPRHGPLSRRAESWVAGLLLIVDAVATQEQIAPRLLATRADVEGLARRYDQTGRQGISDHPVMNGWRRDLLGVLCEGWLCGDLGIVSDASESAEVGAVRLMPRTRL
jgi:ribonuclease D